jgi:hypothetical protein
MYTGANIIRNGLVLALDAASKNSYPGSGTTWTDLSGNNNNGTLVNSPTFSSADGGSIVFNGTTQYITTGKQINVITSNWTVNVWFKTTGSDNIGSLVVRGFSGESLQWRCELQASTGKVNFLMRNGSDQSVLGTTATNNTGWHMATYTNNSNLVTVYLDGIAENSATITNLSNIPYNVVLGRLGDSVGVYYYRGNIATTQIYNRNLTTTEILQNYNATKSRFNL